MVSQLCIPTQERGNDRTCLYFIWWPRRLRIKSAMTSFIKFTMTWAKKTLSFCAQSQNLLGSLEKYFVCYSRDSTTALRFVQNDGVVICSVQNDADVFSLRAELQFDFLAVDALRLSTLPDYLNVHLRLCSWHIFYAYVTPSGFYYC